MSFFTFQYVISSCNSVTGRRKKKRRKPREAVIGEMEASVEMDEEERARMLLKPRDDDPLGDGQDRSHLEARKQIEDLRASLGQEDWLQGRAGEKVHEILGIQKEENTVSISEVILLRDNMTSSVTDFGACYFSGHSSETVRGPKQAGELGQVCRGSLATMSTTAARGTGGTVRGRGGCCHGGATSPRKRR